MSIDIAQGFSYISLSPYGFHLHGLFKNFNTIEEFRSPETKKAIFDKMASEVGLSLAQCTDGGRSWPLSRRRSRPSISFCF